MSKSMNEAIWRMGVEAMSKMSREKQYRQALEHIVSICADSRLSEGLMLGQIMEIAQAAIYNADAPPPPFPVAHNTQERG